MSYLVCMYASGMKMDGIHKRFRDEHALIKHLFDELYLDSDNVDLLLDGNVISDDEGEAFYYLINEVISENC